MTQPNDERPSDEAVEVARTILNAEKRLSRDSAGSLSVMFVAALAIDAFARRRAEQKEKKMSGSMTQEEWEASNFNNSEVERLRERAEQAEKELERAKEFFGRSGGCPCRIATPCRPDCSCVTPGSSRGCRRCFKYGSDAQRGEKAKLLARVIDAGCEALAAHPQPAPSEMPPATKG